MSHILFIDDDLALSDKLSEYLKSEGFQVSVVPDEISGAKKSLHVITPTSQNDNLSQAIELEKDSRSTEILSAGKIKMHMAAREVTCADDIIELTSTEYNLLEVLLRDAGYVVTKEVLSENALGRSLSLYDRSIDMHISNLRQKLTQCATDKSIIKTVRGVGYQFTGLC